MKPDFFFRLGLHTISRRLEYPVFCECTGRRPDEMPCVQTLASWICGVVFQLFSAMFSISRVDEDILYVMCMMYCRSFDAV